MNKVLITGAFGFLGKATASYFSERGWQVYGVGRGKPDYSIKNNIFTSWISAEITLDVLIKFDICPDVIIHCAGGSSVSKAEVNPVADYDSTVGSTIAILELQRKYLPNTHLIFISSAAIYGNSYHTPILETATPLPISVYGQHKLQAEILCADYVNDFQLNISIIRFFSLYGPGLRKQLLWDAANKVINGKNTFFGSGQEMRDFLYVTDAVELLYLLCNLELKGLEIFNGGSGISVSTKEIIECLFRLLGAKDMPQFSQKQNPGDPQCLVSNNLKSSKLGWKPKTLLTEGLKNYIEWFDLIKSSS